MCFETKHQFEFKVVVGIWKLSNESRLSQEKNASRLSQEKQKVKELFINAQGKFVAKESYPAAGCARVSTNENVQLVCSRKPNKKKWQNQEGK